MRSTGHLLIVLAAGVLIAGTGCATFIQFYNSPAGEYGAYAFVLGAAVVALALVALVVLFFSSRASSYSGSLLNPDHDE